MSSNYSVHTVENQQNSTLVLGNTHSIGLYLSHALLHHNLSVSLVCSDQDIHYPSFLSSLSKSPQFHHHQTVSQVSLQSFVYVFHIVSPGKDSLTHLHNSIELAQQYKAKFSLISAHPHPNSPSFNNKLVSFLDNITQSLELVKTHKELGLNARVVHLHHLYGPATEPFDSQQLGFVFSAVGLGQYALADNDKAQVFPMFVSDASQGILKASLSSHTQNKIFELGGSSMSLLNFTYKVRVAAERLGLVQSPTNLPPPLLTNKLESLIWSTHQQLNWATTTNLEEGIQQTINWHLNHPGFAPSQPSFFQSVSPVKPISNFSQQNLDTIPLTSNSVVQPSPHLTTSTQTATFNTNIAPQLFSFVKATLSQIHTTKNLGPTQSLPNPTSQPSSQLKTQPITNHPKTFSPLTAVNQVSPTKPSKIKFFLALFLIFTILVLTPVLFLTFNLYQTTNLLKDTKTQLQSGQIIKAHDSAVQAATNISTLNFYHQKLYPLSQLILGHHATTNITDLLNISLDTTSSVINATNAVSTSRLLLQHITDQGRGDFESYIKNTQAETVAAYHNLSQLEASLKSKNHLFSIELFSIGQQLRQLNDYLPEFRNNLDRSQALLEILPSLLGDAGKKTYLILLQNNAELRPTGGFIGSYALVTFESGVLLDIKVEDVYNADGQLKGHVEPPLAIKQYLGEAGWFLRDSNWDPNFSTSAKRAAWFLDKELGQKVDGVIALNLHSIKDILEITGPVDVPDYDEIISSSNLFERVEYQVEINQFPGSTQKKDFIGKLTNALLDQLLSAQEQTWFQLLHSFILSADQSQILVYTNNPKNNSVFSNLGWSGDLLDASCPNSVNSSICYPDYLGIYEANVGVNKVNYFIRRNLELQSNIDQSGGISSTLNIKYSNTSPGETWPGGVYKNYLRVYTPLYTQLGSISINGQPIGVEGVDHTQEHNKSVFGILVQIPPGESRQVAINYRLPQKLPNNHLFSYSLTFQKQSGTGPDNLDYSISFPDNLTPAVTKPSNSSLQFGSIGHTTSLSRTKHFTVEFAH